MVRPSEVTRSAETAAADWIGPRLGEFGNTVTSVVPKGFESYARVLHPAGSVGEVGPVRWRDVAKWSGLPLRSNGQFHSVALPPEAPQGEAPWSGSPRLGRLTEADAERLVALLQQWTSTPGECWFALWDGYGWQTQRDRREPRVHLPNRDYLLYAGPVGAVATTTSFDEGRQTPNLWWPADEAWCVASEIDLPWTYIGGSTGMVERLVGDRQIEALAIGPDEPIGRIEEWVMTWADRAIEELWASGESTIVTPAGTVEVFLTRPGRIRGGSLRTVTSRPNGGSGSSWAALGKLPPDRLRGNVADYVTSAVVGLVESSP